jgi:prophage maintenance system killer protein
MLYPTIEILVPLLERVGFTINDLGLLDAALARPQVTFGGQQLYATFELQAAAMVHSVIMARSWYFCRNQWLHP